MKWIQNWKLLVLFLLYKLKMVQHLQLQWGTLCHYSRQACWTPISAGSSSVAWRYLLVTFLHGITFPVWPGVYKVLYGRRHRVPVYFLLSLLCVALIVPRGRWEEALWPVTLLQSVCDPSWWLGSTGVLRDASAAVSSLPPCLPAHLALQGPHLCCFPGLTSPFLGLL